MEPSVRADDAVAGDQDQYRVLAAGGAHRAAGLRLSDRLRDLGVGAGFAEGDIQERGPDALLKRRAFRGYREIKPRPPAGEVFLELLFYFGKRWVFRGFRRRASAFVLRAAEPQGQDGPAVQKNRHRAESCFKG